MICCYVAKVFFPGILFYIESPNLKKNPEGPTPQARNPINWNRQPQTPNPRPQPHYHHRLAKMRKKGKKNKPRKIYSCFVVTGKCQLTDDTLIATPVMPKLTATERPKFLTLPKPDFTGRLVRYVKTNYIVDWLAESESHFLGHTIVAVWPINNVYTTVT